jgi:hypothetical protein
MHLVTSKFATPLVALIFLVSATASLGQQTIVIQSGKTTIRLAESFISTLTGLGVQPGTVSPTQLKNGAVDFPITGGAIDLATAKGQAIHSGGLTFTSGSTEVRLESLIIDTTGTTPQITGLLVVDNVLAGRLPLFDLQLPTGVTLPLKVTDDVLRLTDAGVVANSATAKTLSDLFHVTVPANLVVGTASAVAIPTGPSDANSK